MNYAAIAALPTIILGRISCFHYLSLKNDQSYVRIVEPVRIPGPFKFSSIQILCVSVTSHASWQKRFILSRNAIVLGK